MHPEMLTAHIPYSAEEFTWARWRPAAYRTPLPAVGDRVWYRRTDWVFEVGATVLEIQDLDEPGPVREWADPGRPPFETNCWRVKTNPATATPLRHLDGSMVMERHPDAWPTLLLLVDRVDDVPPFRTLAREARLRGSAGWLPLDWTTRIRPRPGRPLPDHRSAA